MRISHLAQVHRRAVNLHLMIICLSGSLTGCMGFDITRYSEGPLTTYLTSPIPKVEAPIAQTVNVETIDYLTAKGLKGMMISDLVAPETFFAEVDRAGKQECPRPR